MVDQNIEQVVQSDALVKMGDCITCHKPWTMTPGEHRFFTLRVEEAKQPGAEPFTMPKRCSDCRKAKNKNRLNPQQVLQKIEDLAQQADDGYYALEDVKLGRDIRKLGTMVKELFGGGKK